jgi:hypothetical protein
MEKQIEDLIRVLKDMTDRDARTGAITGAISGKSIKQQKEFQKELAKTIEVMKKEKKLSEDEIKNLQDLNKEFDKAEDNIREFSNELGKAADALGPFVRTALKLGDAQAKAESDFQTVATTFSKFGITGDTLQLLGGSLDYNIATFRELSQVGASFGKSLIDMRYAAQSANLPLGEFAGLVADNAMSLSALFGTTEQGIRSLASFSAGIRNKALQDGLFGLGVTTEELNEYLGTYLERQRFSDQRSQMTEAQVIQATVEYTKQLDILAKVTGIQRKQIDETIRDQQKDAILQRALTGLTEEQKIQANSFLAVLKNINPALADNAKVLMETGVPFDEFGEKLIGTNSDLGNILVNFKDLIRQGKSVPEVLALMSAAGKEFKGGFDQATLAFGGLAEVGDTNQQLAALNIDQIEAIKQQEKEQGELLKVLGPFNEEMRKLKTAFAGIQTEFLSTITPGISGIANFLTGDFKDTLVGLGKFMIENPKTTAAAFLAGLGGSMLFDFAKQVSIVYTGVKMALGGFPGMAKFGAMAGKGLGVGVGVGGALLGGEIADRSDSMLGKGAGVATSAASGALAGAMFGPLGALVGGVLGAGYGAFRASDLDTKLMDFLSGGSRNLGTMGAIGQTFEPKTSLLKVHAGERVLNQGETSRYNQDESRSQTTSSNTLNQLNEIMKEVNKSLNTGNMIAAMIEKNTKSTKNTLARAEGNLV